MPATRSALGNAVTLPVQVSVQCSIAVVASHRFESGFSHPHDDRLQLVLCRLLVLVAPLERFSIPFDCAGPDVADVLAFFDELLKLLGLDVVMCPPRPGCFGEAKMT